MTTGLRTIFRWLSRAVAALLLAIMLVVLGVSAYLGTKHGRTRLASALVADLNRAIPGGVVVHELERFRLTEVVIRGVGLRAPAGNDVLTVGRVRARLAPWSMLRGRFVVSELSLEDGVLDLRFSDDARRSLSSALIDPQAASVPGEVSGALALVIEAAKLERWRLRLPSGAGLHARELELATSSVRFEAGSELRLDIEPLHARLLERDRDVGACLVRGYFRSAGVSRLALDGELFGMQVGLDVTMGEAGHPVSSWKDLPVAIELRASELTAVRLRRLTSSLPWPAIAGPFGAQLSLRGVPEAFDVTGNVQTPAGPLTLQASAHDLSRLQLAVRTERLALGRLATSLPDWQVSGELALRAQREHDRPARVRIESSLSTRVDDHALPQLTLRAERDDAAAWQLELALDDRWMSLSAQGSWARDGSGRSNARAWVSSKEGLALVRALGLPRRWGLPAASDRVGAAGRLDSSLELVWSRSGNLDARGTLGARELELGSSRFTQLAVGLALAGPLDSPRLRVDGHWRTAPQGSDELTAGRLQLEGGPRRYRLHLSSGTLAFGSFAASGWLERQSGARRFGLTANGRYGAAPWRLALSDARLLDAGQLSLPHVELELCEQRFLLHGRYASAGSKLVLELDDVDVGRLLQPFWETNELIGSLSGRVEARGDLKRPELQLSLRGSRFGSRRRATLDARLDGTLDARAGHFQIRAEARESAASSAQASPRLDITLDASGQVAALQPWPRGLRAGQQRARIEIKRLESSVLEELVGAELPASFDVHGSVDVDVRRGAPTLAYAVAGRVGWIVGGATTAGGTDRSRSARLEHSLRFEAGRAETELSLSDGEGPWIALRGNVTPFGERPLSLADLVRQSKTDWMHRLATAAWRIDIDARRRPLGGLPVPAWLGRVSGAALAARLVAHRDRGAQPVGELAFDFAGAAQPEAPAGPAAAASSRASRCSAYPLTTQGTLRLNAGRFEAELAALDADERKLHLAAHGEVDVSAWLSGRAPSRPRLDVVVDAAALPLERLPFVCDELRGELTAAGRVSDLFGRAEASGDVRITRFSLGSDQTVDVDARASLDAARFELAGKVLTTDRESSFQIRVPGASGSAPGGGAPAPGEASFELSRIPLAPLVPLYGPVSHASGHVSGSVRASTGAGVPQLSGKLRLEGVGLTITDLAQPLSDINGELSLSDGALTLKRLSARDGDGELELSGKVKLSSARDFDGQFELRARQFPLRQSGEVVAQTTATAKVVATWRPERNRLRVELENFDTWLERREPSRGMSLAPHPDLQVKPALSSTTEQEPDAPHAFFARAEPAQPAAPVPLSVEIDAAKQFWVKRADFAFKLSADLDIDIQPSAPSAERPGVSVKGQLRFERGYMEMMGKTFEVKQGGLLRFTGGTSAVLDLTAHYEDRRSSQRVVLHLQGSVAAPKLDFSVDGEKVSAGEAFQAIYGSNKTSRDDVEPEAQASQIIGALMAGVLTTSIRRKLGSMAPILSVDPADDDRGDQVRAGFELDALIPSFLRDIVTGVYVEGSVSSEKQGEASGQKDVQTGVLIELYFLHDLVSSGRYGPDTTWSFDVGWQPRGGR
jgi:autotransporter translocation and assembly factor TamB